MKKSIYIMTASALILSACSAATDSAEKGMESAKKVASEAAAKVNMDAKLEAILAAQADKAKTRFDARNPKETLKFFGIKEGMTVVEALPGGGWYSKILIPYLGDSGHLIGVDYSLRMWPEFGGFANEEFIEKKKTWAVQAAGFELVKESAINENPRDVPTNEESVWRLPPTLGGSKDNPEMRAKMQAIGESNRMTLLFKKI